MYVCLCKVVTERQIHHAVAQGARSVDELQARLDVSTGCGRCAGAVAACLEAALERHGGRPIERHAGAREPAPEPPGALNP